MDIGSGLVRAGSLLLAAFLGGAAAVGIGAAIDDDPDAQTVVSTVAADPAPAKFEPSVTGTGSKSIQQIYEEAGPGVVQPSSCRHAMISSATFLPTRTPCDLRPGGIVARRDASEGRQPATTRSRPSDFAR